MSKGKEETKLKPTKCKKQTGDTNTARVAPSCLRIQRGRAKVLPGTTSFAKFHGLSLALCLGWKVDQRGSPELWLTMEMDVRKVINVWNG